MEEFLIANTTRQQREAIVNESLGITTGCDDIPQSMIDMYQPYIDGEIELRDITMAHRSHYVSGKEMPTREECGYY